MKSSNSPVPSPSPPSHPSEHLSTDSAVQQESIDWDELENLLNVESTSHPDPSSVLSSDSQRDLDLEIDAIFDEIISENNNLRKKVMEAQEKLKCTTEIVKMDVERHHLHPSGHTHLEQKTSLLNEPRSHPNQDHQIEADVERRKGHLEEQDQRARNPQSSDHINPPTTKKQSKKNLKKKFVGNLSAETDKLSNSSTYINGNNIAKSQKDPVPVNRKQLSSCWWWISSILLACVALTVFCGVPQPYDPESTLQLLTQLSSKYYFTSFSPIYEASISSNEGSDNPENDDIQFDADIYPDQDVGLSPTDSDESNSEDKILAEIKGNQDSEVEVNQTVDRPSFDEYLDELFFDDHVSTEERHDEQRREITKIEFNPPDSRKQETREDSKSLDNVGETLAAQIALTSMDVFEQTIGPLDRDVPTNREDSKPQLVECELSDVSAERFPVLGVDLQPEPDIIIVDSTDDLSPEEVISAHATGPSIDDDDLVSSAYTLYFLIMVCALFLLFSLRYLSSTPTTPSMDTHSSEIADNVNNAVERSEEIAVENSTVRLDDNEESDVEMIGVTPDGSRGGYRMKSGEGRNYEEVYRMKSSTSQPQQKVVQHVPLPILSASQHRHPPRSSGNVVPLPAMTVQEALAFSISAKNVSLQE